MYWSLNQHKAETPPPFKVFLSYILYVWYFIIHEAAPWLRNYAVIRLVYTCAKIFIERPDPVSTTTCRWWWQRPVDGDGDEGNNSDDDDDDFVICLPTEHLGVRVNSLKRVRKFQIELEFKSVGF